MSIMSDNNIIKLIYVLKLESGKYFIGSTDNLNASMYTHEYCKGSIITRIYRPINIDLIETYSLLSRYRVETDYVKRYGRDNVYSDTSDYSITITIINKPDEPKKTVETHPVETHPVETPVLESPKREITPIETKTILIASDNTSSSIKKPVRVKQRDIEPVDNEQSVISNIFEKTIEKSEITNDAVTPDKKEEEPKRNLRDVSPDSRKRIQKELKEKHDAKVAETAKRLKMEGKHLKDVLTEENLKEWLINKGLGYSEIAREYAGCSVEMVSQYAGKYNLKSQKAVKVANPPTSDTYRKFKSITTNIKKFKEAS